MGGAAVNQEAVSFLIQLLNNFRISHCLWLLPEEQGENFDLGLRRQLFEASDSLYEKVRLQMQALQERTIYDVEDLFGCRYICLRLPEEGCLSIGPIRPKAFDQEQLLHLSQTIGLPATRYGELLEYYDRLPVLPLVALQSLLQTMAQTIFGGIEHCCFRVVKDSLSRSTQHLPALRSDLPQSPMQRKALLEERYRQENALIAIVQTGNSPAAIRVFGHFSEASRSLPVRLGDQLRDKKDLLITLNTLLRKAAEGAHVHPVHIDELSNQSVVLCEQIQNLYEVEDMGVRLIERYCRLIEEHSLRGYSLLVQQGITIIDMDLTAALSLRQLAEQLSVNPSYFSALFKQDVGITLTEYINTRRLQRAAALLRETLLPVQEIAALVGLEDIHYFGRLFKRSFGCSPTQFRNTQRPY